MAYIQGTASSHTDFYSKFIAFLTSNATLVAASRQWTVVWTAPVSSSSPTDVVLKAPGSSGTDNIYVGFRRYQDIAADNYWIEMFGMTGFAPGATEIEGHNNVSPAGVRMFLDASPFEFWMVANGRRFVVVLKISTVFESMYGGFFLPFTLPTAYPYPLFIGGSSGQRIATALNWRSQDVNHRHFMTPQLNSLVGGGGTRTSGAWFLNPQGEWLPISTQENTSVGMHPERGGNIFELDGDTSRSPKEIYFWLTESPGSQKVLTPETIVQLTPSRQSFGQLDSVYHVPGHLAAAEDIVVANAKNHLIVQNVFRTAQFDYWALTLE